MSAQDGIMLWDLLPYTAENTDRQLVSSPSPFGAAQMDEGIREMARRCYGYGRWDAPYWFIGPEQGMAPDENNDLKPRVKAWLDLGGQEVSDCREFHKPIGEKRWHREIPQLQPC
jgi:hypothetical protein